MSIKHITDLEVVNNEENITGEESILMVQDNQAKLVPMNMVKASNNEDASGSGMLIVDMSNDTDGTCSDKTIGDAVKEAVQTGTPFCFYMLDEYYFPTHCKINSTTSGDIWYHKLQVTCGSNTGIMKFYLDVTDKF